MSQQLEPGETTYTVNRIKEILNKELYNAYDDDQAENGIPVEFYVERSEINTHYAIHDIKAAQLKAATKRCREYCDVISSVPPAEQLASLDHAYSKLIECNFQPRGLDTVIDRTCRRLTRLPVIPPAFGNRCTDENISKLDENYFIHGSQRKWDNLEVVRYVDTNVIRLALQIELADGWWVGIFRLFVNTISSLLTAALKLQSSVDPAHAFILQAFLWTSWQRAVILLFSVTLEAQIRIGYDSERNRHLSVDIVPSILKELRTGPDRPEIPGYMCKWAFEFLRSDRAAVALDFRAFLERYRDVFGHLPPRCVMSAGGRTLQCEGSSPHTCMRFKGMKIEDQSAHTSSCSGAGQCRKLFWNEQSYRGQSGARAVNINDCDHDQLNYCIASGSTMTISHVWSHGQGGRPEIPEQHGTGLNSCLHERYAKIARHFGCDSYWMDTPCIPQDHQLRREAIENINSVFATSKLTLVCDKDLMQIDVSNRTTKLSESLLSVLLVCDWNMRAWTFLEANRGRNGIHLLCKDDQVVPLKEVLDDVSRNGNLTVATLLLTAQHLMPAQGIPKGGTPSEALNDRARGFVSIHEASCLLSHRHASRENDEVIIWSLLCREDVKETAADLWRSMIGRVIPTGYLMSNHPRIGYEVGGHKGLGWAPRRPDMPDDSNSSGKRGKVFFADDGSNSAFGRVMSGGFRAKWLVYEFGTDLRLCSILLKALWALSWAQFRTNYELRRIATKFLANYRWGALLQAGKDPSVDVPVQYRGDSDGTLVAVIGSNDKEEWHWLHVYEWKVSISLPAFRRKEILLI